jgi:hypothetical protein
MSPQLISNPAAANADIVASSSLRPTPEHRLDEAVARLQAGALAFVRMSIGERIALVRTMQAGILHVAEQIVRVSCDAKGIHMGTPAEAEEWATGPWCIVRHLRLIAESLESLQRTGNTRVGKTHRTAEHTLAVGLFPASAVDGVLYRGITADAHMLPGVTEAELRDQRAGFYRGRAHAGRTVLVLGAGNLAAIPAMDVITKMFNEGKTCLLKMNPVNAYLGPFFEQAFAEAIRRNFLAVVYGGSSEGDYLTRHTGIDEIHLKG